MTDEELSDEQTKTEADERSRRLTACVKWSRAVAKALGAAHTFALSIHEEYVRQAKAELVRQGHPAGDEDA